VDIMRREEITPEGTDLENRPCHCVTDLQKGSESVTNFFYSVLPSDRRS